VCDRSADDAFGRLVQRLAAAGRLLIVSHARPDGDTLGSAAALAAAAIAAGKAATVLLPGPLPPQYAMLFAAAPPAGAERFAALADEADVVVIVDTCAAGQLDDVAPALAGRREKTVVVDHHATTDDIADVRWIDTTAAAAGVMTWELIAALGWPVPPAAAEALWVAVATDTGWFRFSNTDGRCLRIAAGLLDAGVSPDELYARLYQSDRPERLRLVTRALQSLTLHAGGRVATMVLRRADFAQTGARADETENIVNEALRMGCVEVAVLLAESPDAAEPAPVRASLRSRGGVDVARLARRFGGGGHARAAGLRREGDIDALAAELVAACAEALGEG